MRLHLRRCDVRTVLLTRLPCRTALPPSQTASATLDTRARLIALRICVGCARPAHTSHRLAVLCATPVPAAPLARAACKAQRRHLRANATPDTKALSATAVAVPAAPAAPVDTKLQLPRAPANTRNHKTSCMVTQRRHKPSSSPWRPLAAQGEAPGAQGGIT